MARKLARAAGIAVVSIILLLVWVGIVVGVLFLIREDEVIGIIASVVTTFILLTGCLYALLD